LSAPARDSSCYKNCYANKKAAQSTIDDAEKGKAKVTVHALKGYRGIRVTAALILNPTFDEVEWLTSRSG
jgi:hypothetical protein